MSFMKFLWNDNKPTSVGPNSTQYTIAGAPVRVTASGLAAGNTLPVQISLEGIHPRTRQTLQYWGDLWRNGTQVALTGTNNQLYETIPGRYRVVVPSANPFGAPVAIALEEGDPGDPLVGSYVKQNSSFGVGNNTNSVGRSIQWLWNDADPTAVTGNQTFTVAAGQTAQIICIGLTGAAQTLAVQVAAQGSDARAPSSRALQYWADLYRSSNKVQLSGVNNAIVEWREGTYRVVVPAARPYGANVMIGVIMHEGTFEPDVETSMLTGAIASSLGGPSGPPPPPVVVNLGYTPSATNGQVTSSAGASATIPTATATNAGLMAPGLVADAGKLVAVGPTGGYVPVTPAASTVIADNLTTTSPTTALAANQGVILNAADIASGAVVANNLEITLKGGTKVIIDVTTLIADIKLQSGTYNALTQALDLLLSNGSTVSVPVAALLPVQSEMSVAGVGDTANKLKLVNDVLAPGNNKTYGTDATGVRGWRDFPAAVAPATVAPLMDGVAAVGTATSYAREDHVHASDTTRVAKTGDTMTGILTGTATEMSSGYVAKDRTTPTNSASLYVDAGVAALWSSITSANMLTANLTTGIVDTPNGLTVPTKAPGDNTTNAASTAFVQAALTAAVVPATAAPLMDGTAAVGTATKYAREDHVHASDTTRVAKAGDTMTGPLTIGTSNELILDGAAGTYRAMSMRTAGSLRWYTGASPAAEGGSNAGSDFQLLRYNDAGGYVATALTVARATGVTNFEARPTVTNGAIDGFFKPNQAITAGGAQTITDSTSVVYVNPTATLATLVLTLPATPVDKDRIEIVFGGSITSGAVVTAMTWPASVLSALPTTLNAGETAVIRYHGFLGKWIAE